MLDQGKVYRVDGGGRSNPFRYFTTDAGMDALQVPQRYGLGGEGHARGGVGWGVGFRRGRVQVRRGEMGCRLLEGKGRRWDGGGGSEGVEEGKGVRRGRGGDRYRYIGRGYNRPRPL